MPITIRHGAELEGRGLAYGAAAQAAFARRQREEQEKKEKKAKKLGDIGSILSTAGAVTTFIPGLQPVGVGLSIAGGALGQMAGGRGDPTGRVIATTAQGISQIYRAQEAKIQERETSFQDWKKRQDYTKDLTSMSDAESLAEQKKIRDDIFTAGSRTELRRLQQRQQSVWEAAGLDKLESAEIRDIKANPQHPKYGMAQAATSKVAELHKEYRTNMDYLKEQHELDPATGIENAIEKMEEERVTVEKRNQQQLKVLEQQEKADLQAAEDRTRNIQGAASRITDLETQISISDALDDDDPKKLGPEAYDAALRERNIAISHLQVNLVAEEQSIKIELRNGNPQTIAAGRQTWIQQRVQAKIAANISDPDAESLALYYEGVAKTEYRRLLEENPATLEAEIAELLARNRHGI